MPKGTDTAAGGNPAIPGGSAVHPTGQHTTKRIMGTGKTDFRANLAVALFEANHAMVLHAWSDETRKYWLKRADAAIEPATNQAGEVERNLEAQRQTIEACACLVDRHPMRMDDNARMTLADAIRCLTPDESLAGDTLDAKTADYNGHKPNRYLPEIPHGASLFAVNPSTGAWHYVNHAGTWQGMPNPLATQPATSQEGANWRVVLNTARQTVKTRDDMQTALNIIESVATKALAATPTPPAAQVLK